MLINIDTLKEIGSVPHKKEFDFWMSKLSAHDYQRIVDDLNQRIDGSEILTSSWIPGSNWGGTVFQPIFDACQQDPVEAAKFFGLIVYQVMIERPEKWAFGRYEKDGIPIKGMTYFRIP